MGMELWTNVIGPADLPAQAAAAEAAGWHGTVLYDSQNFNSDCYVAAGVVGGATTDLKIATGVTNPFTRHPAVTASAAASAQVASNGRFTLGIGRGDSSNASVGFAPSSVDELDHYVRLVRAYLRRETVSLADLERYGRGTKPAAATLHLAHTFDSSALDWWTPRAEEPPAVDVAATGPRVLGVGATAADSISLTVGADVDRVTWAIDIARKARADAGIDGELEVGAYLNLACHPDEQLAMEMISGPIAAFARFSAMHGKTVTPMSSAEQQTLDELGKGYDMTHHGESGSPQAEVIDVGFARRFAVIGTPEACIEKLQALHRAGVNRFILLGPEPNTPRYRASADAQWSQQLFDREVLSVLGSNAS